MRSTLKCDIMLASSGGFISMKTKIIYISGNEVFDMTDIRAAFEEVRNTLGLGADTVLFGVPVDSDNALAKDITNQSDVAENTEEPTADYVDTNEIIDTEFIEEPAVDMVIEKKTKKQTAKKSRAVIKKEKDEGISDTTKELKSEQIEDIDEPTEEKIIPILSVLATKNASEIDETTEEMDVDEPEKELTVEKETKIIPDTQTVSIEDMINDDAPSEPIEKTLEQLLESMTPLREDTVEEHEEQLTANNSSSAIEEDSVIDINEEDADATLEKLAAEFAETEDKIPSAPQTESHSKIGKLKNILPFKKAKREDSGLMGDLFGWAGIAANDDDFTMPGFFTNAASKK